jgi:predicted NAD/FAD-binding protein
MGAAHTCLLHGAGRMTRKRNTMKIAIIGSGIAGLTAAWLLDQNHEVTIFEKNKVLGGHALTVDFEINGRKTFANPAAGYITPNIYPFFLKLLHILDVKTIPVSASVTVYSKALRRASMLTPRMSLKRLMKLADPRIFPRLLEVQRVLFKAKKFDLEDDWMTTLEDFMDEQLVSAYTRTEIIYPWVSAVCEVTIEEVKKFSARAALRYPVGAQFGTQNFELWEVENGIAAYIPPLLATLRKTQVQAGSGIQAIERKDRQYILTDSSNTKHSFDHVIFASQGHDTKKIIDTLSGADELQNVLSEFKYLPARIAVHGDTSYMPPKRVDWSTYNSMYDGKNCEATIWCPEDGEHEYFKSWVIFAKELPKKLYSVHEFNHPVLTPQHYHAQAKLKPLNGQDNLWFVGSYTQDIDSHESGVLSAMEVAQKLDPESENLKLLQ